MALGLSQWRPWQLVTAWIGWWIAVPLVGLSRALIAVRHATTLTGEHGSVSLNVGSDGLGLTVVEAGHTTWTNSISPLAAVLVLSVPPLLLWVAWLRARSRGAALEAPAPALINSAAAEPRYSETKSADLDRRAPGA